MSRTGTAGEHPRLQDAPGQMSANYGLWAKCSSCSLLSELDWRAATCLFMDFLRLFLHYNSIVHSCDWDLVAGKAQNIYYLAILQKNFASLCYRQ